MILFRPEHAGPILAGVKTETRRLWPKGCRVVAGRERRVYVDPPFTGGAAFARVLVTDVWRERLRAIDTGGALREGYPTRSAYLEAFDRINGGRFPVSTQVWAVRFVLLEGFADVAVDLHSRLMDEDPLRHYDGWLACRCQLAWAIRGLEGLPPGPVRWEIPPKPSSRARARR